MGRKKPFSGKAKKEQLQQKRQRNLQQTNTTIANTKITNTITAQTFANDILSSSSSANNIISVNAQPSPKVNTLATENKSNNRNRFNLQFERESKAEIEERKRLAQRPLVYISEIDKEIDINDIYPPTEEFNVFKRPEWNYEMSKEELDRQEQCSFNESLMKLKNSSYGSRLSHFEHNLETWRQLWRVFERSDIVAMVADVRFVAFHFCRPLYTYVTEELKKPMILILNKIDSVPLENVIGWKMYLEENYPKLTVTTFTSYPKDPTNYQVEEGKVLKKKKLTKKKYVSYGCLGILECCQQLLGPAYDLDEWRQKMADDKNQFFKDNDDDDLSIEHHNTTNFEGEEIQHNDNYITLGMVGYPNVGKSSVINALMGRKVVSISRTPGHTKYFQTIFLTKNVCLCDCPGLVFPSVIDKPFQILAGVYPIAQVQEPYTAVGYLAARADLPKLLQLKHPNDIDKDTGSSDDEAPSKNSRIFTVTPNYRCKHQWSAWDVCESWAYKRGFMTAKSGCPDVYRAANNILQLSVQGKLNMYMSPILFHSNYETIRNNPEVKKLRNDLLTLNQWKTLSS